MMPFRVLLLLALILVAGWTPARAVEPPPAPLRTEVVPLNGGELLILKRELPPAKPGESAVEIPLFAVLRDTLGDRDPENDRLRNVWSFTYTKPSVWRRAASALPFYYGRVGGKGKVGDVPASLLDLSRTDRPVWERMFGAAAQRLVLDTQGTFFRSSSRTFRGNAHDYRQAHIFRALSALSGAEDELLIQKLFTSWEMTQLEARLGLATQAFGGLVSDGRLARYNSRRRTDLHDARGHNWELLRQRADAEGLVFEPLLLQKGGAQYGLLSVAKEDLARPQPRNYSGQFLRVADPWRDSRLQSWKGIVRTRDAAEPGEAREELIPLGLYSLDHPRVPLLMVDFRHRRKPRQREVTQRAVSDVANGVLGLSYVGNWYYFAGNAMYDFVSTRHGAARDRAARAKAYEDLRLSLMLDRHLDPSFHQELVRQLNTVSLNPLSVRVEDDADLARRQYAALVKAARDPRKLSVMLERDRAEEMTALVHGPKTRSVLHLLNLMSLGLYTHRETPKPALLVQLERSRRIASHRRFLDQVLAAGPEPELYFPMSDVQQSLTALAEAGEHNAVIRYAGTLFERTADEPTRLVCLKALGQLQTPAASQKARRLASLSTVGLGSR